MDFTLTVLGTASAMPVTGRYQSAQVLRVQGRFFLIDCGEGVQRRLLQFRVPMMRIDAIFLSHIHGDHVFGLPALLSTLGMNGRRKPLNIYAPENFSPILKFFLSYYGEWLPYEIRHIPLTMKAPETVCSTKTLEILAFPLNHKIETYGFFFREKMPLMNVRKEKIAEYGLTLTEIGSIKRGEDVVRSRPDGSSDVIPFAEVGYQPYIPRSYAYCSDTAPFPELAGWLRGVDLLYHETTYLDEMAEQAAQRYHSTTLQAARCALEAGARKLVIGHYSSRNQEILRYQAECRTVFPDTWAAEDGDIFEVPLVRPE
ncbi:MAG: ribonuclease Z [Bacteroidales bacterium]|jgi:ribonuclease Z|nr:ribonuclease Z [Bacteroidota bacterium]NLN99025.1 ribonuclease Z [Bacteroidales bacterium]